MQWMVYVGDWSSRGIETYNIFEHGIFLESCKKAAKKYKEDREAFLKAVESDLAYYFWSKCEWEIILSPWPPHEKDRSVKIDVYDQVMNNKEIFRDYVWNHIDELLPKKGRPKSSKGEDK